MKAKDITGLDFHHTIGDVETLHRLVKMLPANPVIINIGACFGTSALAMLEARPDSYVFSVDINICPIELENIAGYEDRTVRVLGPSQQIDWPCEVDMVFVDGAHGYEQVKRDIQVWRDKIKLGGILAFHDYGKPSLPHVKRAVDDEMGTADPFLHVECIKAYIIGSDKLTRTHFWPETITYLRALGSSLPQDGVVINIGAYWESSTISILYDRKDLFAFSIDTEVCEKGLDNLKHFGMEDQVVRVLGKSQDIDWRFPVDMVYIDGDHSYEGCRGDVDAWVPWVKDGGLIAFHDHGSDHTPGVIKAVNETMQDFECIGLDREDRGVLLVFRK